MFGFNKEKAEKAKVARTYATMSPRFMEEMLKIDLKYNHITQQQYDYKMLECTYTLGSDAYKIAELDLDIKYNKITPEDAEYKRLSILHNPDTVDYKLKKLELDRSHCKIDECDYELEKAKLTITDEKKLQSAVNEIQFKYHKIDENDYNKEKATLKDEPFVGMKSFKLEPTVKDGVKGYELVVEVDNNQEFLNWLRTVGYNQANDDVNVKNFLSENLQEIVGEFVDLDEVEEMKKFRQSDTIYVNETDKANTVSIVGDMKLEDELKGPNNG